MFLRKTITSCAILITLLFSACSQYEPTLNSIEKSLSTTANNFWIKKYPDNVAGEETEVKAFDKAAEETNLSYENSAVEIIWLVPEGRVTKYILRYGTKEENLNSAIELFTKNLTPVMHPKFGKVYKHIIMGVPANSKIYYSLQAGNELGLSDPTPVASEMSREN